MRCAIGFPGLFLNMSKRKNFDAETSSTSFSSSVEKQGSATPASAPAVGDYFLRVSQAVAAVLTEGLSIVDAAQKFNVLKATVQFKVQKELSELTKNQAASAVQINVDDAAKRSNVKNASLSADSTPSVSTPSTKGKKPGKSPSKTKEAPKQRIKLKIKREVGLPKKAEHKKPQEKSSEAPYYVKDETHSLRVSEAAEAYLRGTDSYDKVAEQYRVKRSSVKRRLDQWERVLGLNRSNYAELAHKLKELSGDVQTPTGAAERSQHRASAGAEAPTKKRKKNVDTTTPKKRTKTKSVVQTALAAPPATHATSCAGEVIEEECEVEYAFVTEPSASLNLQRPMKTETLSSLADVALGGLDFQNLTVGQPAATALPSTYSFPRSNDLFISQADFGNELIVTEIASPPPSQHQHQSRAAEVAEEIAAAVASIQAGESQPEMAPEIPAPLPKKEFTEEERKIEQLVDRHCNRCTPSERERIVKALLHARKDESVSLIFVSKKYEAPLIHVKKCWEIVKMMEEPKLEKQKQKASKAQREKEKEAQEKRPAGRPLPKASAAVETPRVSVASGGSEMPKPSEAPSKAKDSRRTPYSTPAAATARVKMPTTSAKLKRQFIMMDDLPGLHNKENTAVMKIPPLPPSNEADLRTSKYSQRTIRPPRTYQDYVNPRATVQNRAIEQSISSVVDDVVYRGPKVNDTSMRGPQKVFHYPINPNPNSFALWCQERRSQIGDTGMTSKEEMKCFGEEWQRLPAEDKEFWRRKAQAIRRQNRMNVKMEMPEQMPRIPRGRPGRKPTRGCEEVSLSGTRDPVEERLNWSRHSRAVLRRTRPASPPRNFATDAMDVAGHFRLLAESMTDLGSRLKVMKDTEFNSTSLDLLLDTFLCSLTPLVAITQYVDQIYDAAKESDLIEAVDNSVYLVPITG